jgi:superfamily II DNA/RNA helicase
MNAQSIMPRELSDLISDLSAALAPQFRRSLLARGQAKSVIRRQGILPDDAPYFDDFLDVDLLNYGYALMLTSLRIMEKSVELGETESTSSAKVLARRGFIQTSFALEAAFRNNIINSDLVFHRLIAGIASHLGGYAARAYSLVDATKSSGYLNLPESVLAEIVLRNLDRVEELTRTFMTSQFITDEEILNSFQIDQVHSHAMQHGSEDGSSPQSPVISLLTENYLSAATSALYSYEVDSSELLTPALEDLRQGENASQGVALAATWWINRLTRALLADLAETSIRKHIPNELPNLHQSTQEMSNTNSLGDWRYLRGTFIDSLLARRRSEIDLWPSQLQVVDRIFEGSDDLVVALPTSAGKTRIAELAILACLGHNRRTVYITPLRALSAQTEQVLDRTFLPLGVEVSSLYGSIGVSDGDVNAIRESQIVVATPEKLDFALRSDPSLLDDVGLVILDEGHMIGPSEREVRYEAQIQRLLSRSDSESRRLICLSAVFPSGRELDDFVAWITKDSADGLHHENWRPTLQRFGLVEWRRDHARLSMTMGGEQAFIPRYFEVKNPTGRRRRTFPSSSRELTIATAWRLIEENQTVLIFCPERRSVEPYARELIKLHREGLIESVLADGVDLTSALTTGAEWFGADHPVLECLRLGVAIHHGALPGPFRREIESLLKSGAIKITIASPTLAQGLNLSASAVLFHGVYRFGELLSGSEFANVVGRAGRAYIDTEGLVLFPIFEPTEQRRRVWNQLSSGEAGKSLRSGLIEIGLILVRRMMQESGPENLDEFLEYVTGEGSWNLPSMLGELDPQIEVKKKQWHSNLALLDIGILSIVGDIANVDLPVIDLLLEALKDSLWDRQLKRLEPPLENALRELVKNRAKFLWSTSTPSERKGWYLAGLGSAAGRQLSEISSEVVSLLMVIENAIASSNQELASELIVEVARKIFTIAAFRPDELIENWEGVLKQWVSGMPLGELDLTSDLDRAELTQFIESALIYRFIWGMEAARVYEVAQGENVVASELSGTVQMAIETGTLLVSAGVLIRAGFDHRGAAISAVLQTNAEFYSKAGMREWILGLDPDNVNSPDWPTRDSHAAWREFAIKATQPRSRKWIMQKVVVQNVRWSGRIPLKNSWLRVMDGNPGQIKLWSAGFKFIGEADMDLNSKRIGTLHARRSENETTIELSYNGPGDLFASN